MSERASGGAQEEHNTKRPVQNREKGKVLDPPSFLRMLVEEKREKKGKFLRHEVGRTSLDNADRLGQGRDSMPCLCLICLRL